MNKSHVAIAALSVLVAGLLVNSIYQTVRGLSDVPLPYLVREIAATDHVWQVDPARGNRIYIANDEDAVRALDELGVSEDLRFGRSPLQTLIAQSQELERPALRDIPVSGKSSEWLVPPEGYRAEIVAGDLKSPRVLGWDPAGRLAVSEHAQDGTITVFDQAKDGSLMPRVVLGRGVGGAKLYNPHGFVFAGGRLIVASELSLDSWPYDHVRGRVTGKPKHLRDLTGVEERFAGQGHRTRTLVLGSDGKLYLSIGSVCDHCWLEREHAVILRMNPDGTGVETFASGLRNTVFFVEDLVRNRWWGNDMGRDDLGEDMPPDELNVLHFGENYGWPLCYGLQEPAPDNPNPERCVTSAPMSFGYQAHAAPLGLRFVPASFNPEWSGSLLVAQHGSTLRLDSVAGYRVIRLIMDEAGAVTSQEDFITGFLKDVSIPAGRPVDLLFSGEGSLFLTDDHAGVIHRIRRAQ